MNETRPFPVGRVLLALFTLFLIFVSGAAVFRIVTQTARDRHETETRLETAVALAEARQFYAKAQTEAALRELLRDPAYAVECRKSCEFVRERLDVVAQNSRLEEVRERCKTLSRNIEDGLRFTEIREELERKRDEWRRETLMFRERFDKLHGERAEMLRKQAETMGNKVEDKLFVPDFLLHQHTQLARLVEQTERIFTLARDAENAVNPQDRALVNEKTEETLRHLQAELAEMKQQMTVAQARVFVDEWEQTLVETTRILQGRSEIGKQLQRLSEDEMKMIATVEHEFEDLAATLSEESRREAENRDRWLSRTGLVCGAGFLFWLFYGILLAVFLVRRPSAPAESDFHGESPLTATPAPPFPARAAGPAAVCDLEPVLEKLREIVELLKR